MRTLFRQNSIVERSNKRTLKEDFTMECGILKLQADELLQKSYSLIAQIRNSLS
jgi:hypothetical protein